MLQQVPKEYFQTAKGLEKKEETTFQKTQKRIHNLHQINRLESDPSKCICISDSSSSNEIVSKTNQNATNNNYTEMTTDNSKNLQKQNSVEENLQDIMDNLSDNIVEKEDELI